jgi:hypothetical protein
MMVTVVNNSKDILVRVSFLLGRTMKNETDRQIESVRGENGRQL